MERLEPIHGFYVENIGIEVEELAQETGKCELVMNPFFYFFILDPSTLRMLLAKYHSQIDVVKRITPQQPFGCFLVHLDDFKKEVLPCCEALLKAVENTIPT